MAGKKGMTGSGLGGWREGVGRPRLSVDRTVHLNVTVTEELAALAYVLGDGSFSVGVRLALAGAAPAAAPQSSAIWQDIIPGVEALALHRQYIKERTAGQTLAQWLEQAGAILWADEHNPAADWSALANALLWDAAHEAARRQLK